MNIKLITKVLFYLIGTSIVLVISVVTAINFVADSRWLSGGPEVQSKNNTDNNGVLGDGDLETMETFKYKRSPAPKDTPSPKPTIKPKEALLDGPIKVEFIYKTGEETKAKDLERALEGMGFQVVLVKSTTLSATTSIVDRNDRGGGVVLQRALKLGTLSRDFKDNYPYDVTLTLGMDFQP